MGTHPIFESDFDCLTDLRNMFRQIARATVSVSRRMASVEIPEGAMAFSFSSPFEQYFDNDLSIKQVDIPTQTGRVGALPGHVPTLGCLAPGVMTIHGADTQSFFVSSGSYTINADRTVSIIAEEAAKLSDLDKDAATKALQAATAKANSGDEEAKIEQEVLQAVVDAI